VGRQVKQTLTALALMGSLLGAGCPSGGRGQGTGASTPARTAAQTARATAKPAQVGQAEQANEDIAVARQQARRQLFTWQPWSKEVFARAKAEGRPILLDGAAEWCHWCHVMDETTYVDPEVGQLLRDRFVAIRVDVDARPDVAARYQDWGWPATVIFSPDGAELGKFRGYLPPDRMREILKEVLAQGLAGGGDAPGAAVTERQARLPAPLAALPWIAADVLLTMDERYDEEQGGWGSKQKLPIGANVEVELLRAGHGDAAARERALFTLRQQRALLDPVWGGIYQYSVGGVWDRPHFEKLMPMQAAAIEAYARAYAVSGDAALRRDAQNVAGYLDRFLSSPEGAFYVSQDADVGAHDKGGRFVDGNVYYRKDDAGRRALGMPRIDDHVYGKENGLAIAALCALYQASRDEAVLRRARRAADLMLRTLILPDGRVRRAAGGKDEVRYLVDAAAMGRALARLHEVAPPGSPPTYKDAAARVAKAMARDLWDEERGLFFASTPDPAAAGLFARRDHPFAQNVLAGRFLAALSRISEAGVAALHRERARRVLAGVATPRGLRDEGRLVGEFLLLADEVGVLPW
jgi:hypothetical protein